MGLVRIDFSHTVGWYCSIYPSEFLFTIQAILKKKDKFKACFNQTQSFYQHFIMIQILENRVVFSISKKVGILHFYVYKFLIVHLVCFVSFCRVSLSSSQHCTMASEVFLLCFSQKCHWNWNLSVISSEINLLQFSLIKKGRWTNNKEADWLCASSSRSPLSWCNKWI